MEKDYFPFKKQKELDWKKYSPLTTKISWLASLWMVILAAVLIPETKPKVERIKPKEVSVLLELPEQLKQLETPPPLARPKLPVEAETDEEATEETIERTEFTGYEPPPPPVIERIPPFYAVQEPPAVLPGSIVLPEYPEMGRQAGIEGVVQLKVYLDTLGKVMHAEVWQTELDESFQQSALTAIYKWRFKPAKQRGRPVKVWVLVPIKFMLREE